MDASRGVCLGLALFLIAAVLAGVGNWNCKCFAIFLFVVVACCDGVFEELAEASSFVCLQVVGAGWFVGVCCVHCCFLF